MIDYIKILKGIGACAGSALLAEVARTTSSRERTTILSLCNGLRQVGLLIGIYLTIFQLKFIDEKFILKVYFHYRSGFSTFS